MPSILPGRRAPALEVETVDGERYILAARHPERFSLLTFYRGYHCPRCRVHLIDLTSKAARFAERGVEVVAVSCDDEEKARKAFDEWQLGSLIVGYGLDEQMATNWDLYFSHAIQGSEPRRYTEPLIALIDPNNFVYSLAYYTSPFYRAQASDILEALDAIQAKNYPPRGGE